MFDLTDLRVFARIADLGSISGTARALKMPKSSVSRSLVRLEASVGAALIERSTRHLRLTDAGLLLQRHARRILDDVGEAENAIGGLVGVAQGDLKISVPFTFATGPLAAMLPTFLARYPEVRTVLTIDNRIVDLLNEDYDVAIRIGPLADSELIARRLTTLKLWPCCSPAYLATRKTIKRPSDLKEHTLIAHGHRNETWRFRDEGGAVSEIALSSSTVIPEPDVVRTMLLGHAGIGMLPDFHASGAIAKGELVRVLPDFDAGGVDVHALYPSHRSLSAKVRVFIDELVAHLGKSVNLGMGSRRKRPDKKSIRAKYQLPKWPTA